MNKWYILTIIFIMGFAIMGCAIRSDYAKGQQSLERGDYDSAVSLFQYSLKTSPNNPKTFASLGYAYYKKNDIAKAIEYLKMSKSADPLYGKAYLYLGMIYEEQDDLPKAIREYNDYYKLAPLTPLGIRLKARIGVLMRNQIAKEIKEAIQREQEISVADIPENTIAVYSFTNQTGDNKLDPLQKGLADMVITDLSQVKSLKVLERTRIQVLMDEIKLSGSVGFEQEDAPRFGRLLGARRLISGGFAAPDIDTLRIDSIATDATTATEEAQVNVSGNQKSFFAIEKKLVFDILDSLNISITQEERDAIQKIPTESFLAFLAYSKGLDYEDRGMYREASQEFKNAIQIDPSFSSAVEKVKETQILINTPMTGSVSEISQIENATIKDEIAKSDATIEQSTLSAFERLEPITQNVGDGFIPSTGTQTEGQRPSPQAQNSTILNLTIEW